MIVVSQARTFAPATTIMKQRIWLGSSELCSYVITNAGPNAAMCFLGSRGRRCPPAARPAAARRSPTSSLAGRLRQSR